MKKYVSIISVGSGCGSSDCFMFCGHMHIICYPVIFHHVMSSILQYHAVLLAFEVLTLLQLFTREFDCFSSGKCQIIHWRQGHKDECRPFTASYQTNDAEGGSSQKVLKQEAYDIHRNSFETDRRQFVKSVQNFPEKPACLNSDFSP